MTSTEPRTTPPPPRQHGGIIAGLAPPASAADGTQQSENEARPLDLSTCVDAFGLLEPVRRALQRVEYTQAYRHYPDPQSRLARKILARVAGVDADCIDVAPGAAELIWTLVRTKTVSGERVLLDAPCFSEFEHAARAHGALVTTHTARVSGGQALEPAARVEQLSEAVCQVRPKLVYLCAPSCPRGEWTPAAGLQRLVAAHPSVTFVIDQSYLTMSAHAEERSACFADNAVLVRSVTKELGLPGVRAGYAVLAPALREQMQVQRPCWPLGAHAQAVLEAYGDCLPWLERRRSLLLEQARELAEALEQLGLNALLRDTHYFTIDLGADRANPGSHPPPLGAAAELTQWLWQEAGIAVRDCASFGLPHHVRVVAHPEQGRLVAACGRWQTLQRRARG